MKIGNSSNYFNRYLKTKRNNYKSSHNTKYSIEKLKQGQLQNDKSTLEILTYNHFNRRDNSHQNNQSNLIDFMITTKAEHNAKQSLEETQGTKDKGVVFKREIPMIRKEITIEHIDFFKNKIKNILNVIDQFEKENNLNQKSMKISILYNVEPQTERINNTIDDKHSFPNTSRFNNKSNRHPSISSRDSTNYSVKKNNNHQSNDASDCQQNKKQANNYYQFSLITKVTQKYSQTNGIKQAVINKPQTKSNITKYINKKV